MRCVWGSFVLVLGAASCGRPAETVRRTAPPLASAVPAPAPPPPAVPAADAPREDAPATSEAVPAPIVLKRGTRVLMFGDSMVTSGLGTGLQERVEAIGGKWFHLGKPSSTIPTWGDEDGRPVRELVERARADVVIVVLSSNELFVPNPRARAYGVRSIVARIGDRACVWIGPSPWRPEKGIVGVVRENVGHCRYFDSTAIEIEKGKDGIHPTPAGGKAWAEAVWRTVFRAE